MAGKVIFGSVGTLLALYAVLIPLLGVVGEKTIAEVTVVRREPGDRQDPVANRYSYAVGFEFTLPDGRIIPGNTKVIGSASQANFSKGPHPVRYLAAFPYINALEADTSFDLGKIVMLGIGLMLCRVAWHLKG